MKPIYVMRQEGITSAQESAVLQGIDIVLQAAQADVEVKSFGVWRHKDWVNLYNGQLNPYMSVDWYVEQGRKASRGNGQLHGGAICNALWQEPWQKSHPHWDVVILKSDIYDDGCNFVIGEAVADGFCIVSVNRLSGLDEASQKECIITETIHELGHVFGLPNDNRGDGTIEQSLGGHCTNVCTMRQGLVVPRDWLRMTQDRLRHGTFCQICLAELRQFFQ